MSSYLKKGERLSWQWIDEGISQVANTWTGSFKKVQVTPNIYKGYNVNIIQINTRLLY